MPIAALLSRQNTNQILDSLPPTPISCLYIRQDRRSLLPATAHQRGTWSNRTTIRRDIHPRLTTSPDPAILRARLQVAGDIRQYLFVHIWLAAVSSTACHTARTPLLNEHSEEEGYVASTCYVDVSECGDVS